MRLIDADALIEEIKTKMPQGGARGVFRAFIDDAPTVYDVEAVVAELDSIEDCVCNVLKCENCKHYSSCYDSGVAERALINKAIDIVKKGGGKNG